jgi:hypothetical protein
MAPAQLPPLRRLLRRLLLSFLLSYLGLLGLVVPRLSAFKTKFPDLIPPDLVIQADALALSLAVLGLLSVIYYAKNLGRRLLRIDALGESNW